MQRSVQRARSPPTSPYAGAEAYTLAYSGAPPSQILAGAPPPLPPPVRNPTGPTSARENALEARELALEERLRYVEAMLAAKTRMEGSVSRGAASRHPWIEPRSAEPPAPGNDAGEVVAWCRAVGEALNGQQLAAHDAVKHAHHQIKLTAAPATGENQCINQILRCFDAIDATSARQRGLRRTHRLICAQAATRGRYCRETCATHCVIP